MLRVSVGCGPPMRVAAVSARKAWWWRNNNTRPQRRRLFASSASAGQHTGFFGWYSAQLDKNPILTKSLSAGVISSIGNIIAQKWDPNSTTTTKSDEEKKGEIDWVQVGRFAFMNVAFVAPVLHNWYRFINRAVPGTSNVQVMKRVFFDEFVFTPFYVPVFMTGLWTLEGTPFETVQKMLWKETPTIVMAEWIVWVPTMTLTFRFVPEKFQVLVINLVGVFWNTILSLLAANAHVSNTEEEDQVVAPTAADRDDVVGTQQKSNKKVVKFAAMVDDSVHHRHTSCRSEDTEVRVPRTKTELHPTQ